MAPRATDKSDGFERSYHSIPGDMELQAMSYVSLADELGASQKDSAKFHVLEREKKRRLAQDQAKVNRSNVFFGACVGGLFGLAGVVLGYYLRAEDGGKQVAPAGAVQKVGNSNLGVEPPIGNVSPITAVVVQPVPHPAPVASNAGAGKAVP